eukprot:555404_1
MNKGLLLELSESVLIYINNFLNFLSLTSHQKTCKALYNICKKPCSHYELNYNIHNRLFTYLADTLKNTKYISESTNMVDQFIRVKKLEMIIHSGDIPNQVVFDYLYKHLYSKIAANSHSRRMDSLICYAWAMKNEPLSFCSHTVHLQYDLNKILPKLYDVESLILANEAGEYSEKCVPYLLLNQNRFNLHTMHITNYQSISTKPLKPNQYETGIYLQSNGLFFNECSDIDTSKYIQSPQSQKLEVLHCDGWSDTIFFLYNIIKLNFQSLTSLHISDTSCRIYEYKAIYGNITLPQLEELCINIGCGVECNVHDLDYESENFETKDCVLNSKYKYFQAPNVKRFTIRFSINEGWTYNHSYDTFNFERMFSAFGMNKVESFAINVNSQTNRRNVKQYWNANVICAQYTEFMKNVVNKNCILMKPPFTFAIYLWIDFSDRWQSAMHCMTKIAGLLSIIDHLWDANPSMFNKTQLRVMNILGFDWEDLNMRNNEYLTKKWTIDIQQNLNEPMPIVMGILNILIIVFHVLCLQWIDRNSWNQTLITTYIDIYK